MKKELLTLASLSSLSLMAGQEQKPNIILFLVDDMGWQDTSVPFYSDTTMWNRNFHTPAMEQLASQGMKFTNAYASSISSPTRVSLFTGVNAMSHGVTNWTLRHNQSTDGNNKTLSFTGWNVNGLSPQAGIDSTYHATPLAQILKDNGYATFIVGKGHFGAISTPGEEPLNLGFDRNVASHAAGGLGSYLGTKNFGGIGSDPVWAVPGLEKYHGQDIFISEALTLEAKELMDEAIEEHKPFFLYMSHYAVHIPFDADKRFYQKYKDRGLEETEARYASIVEGMDKSLGDLMEYVKERGIADNTIIIFMSDNGGFSANPRTPTFNGARKNYPLRSGKGSLYEGGIREPMIVYMPGVTKAASVSDSRVIIEDFFPTILDMAEVKKPQTIQKVEGKSFMAALEGKKINKGRAFYWHFPNDWGTRDDETGRPSSAIMLDGMKLIHYWEDGTNELFNINDDIGENNNLINSSPQYDKIAQKLARILSDELRKNGASVPKFKDSGKQCPYPDQTL